MVINYNIEYYLDSIEAKNHLNNQLIKIFFCWNN